MFSMKQLQTLLILLLVSVTTFAQEEYKHDVYFDTDKFVVPLTEENRLLLFISTLDDVKVSKISIYGFTDDRGTNEYNLVLSQNRADKIKELFAGYGIDENLITNVNGKGEILLKVIKDAEMHQIRGLNRKVEIIVSTAVKKIEEIQEDEIAANKSGDKTVDDIDSGLIKKGDKLRLENINFKTNYSYITKDSKPKLVAIAKILKRNPHVYFTIQGHVCCTEGTRDAIDKKTRKRNLSVERARFIFKYFEDQGINRNRMKYVGMRRKFPLGGEDKYDRRVEILITHIGKKR